MHQADRPSFSSEARSAGRTRGFAALALANVALTFGPVFVRLAQADGVGPVAAAFWRVTLAIPLLVILLRFSGERVPRLGAALAGLLVIGGLCFALDLGAWHIGILKTKLANASLFGNSAVLMFPIYGFIIARAWPSRAQTGALLLALFGALLLMGRSYEASADNLVGDLFCLAAGTLYTGYFIAMTRVREVLGAWSALLLSTIAASVPLLLLALVLGEAIWPQQWGALIGLALVSQVIGQWLMTYALPLFQPIVIGIALLIQPIVSGAVGWMFYNERLGALDFVGALAVAIALVLVRRPEPARPPAEAA